MLPNKQIEVTDYCKTQDKIVSVYGNYIYDGFDGYVLGTILCPYKEAGNKCDEKPCLLRKKFTKNI